MTKPGNKTCPACHQMNCSLWSKAIDYEYQTSNKEYEYYQCKNCETIFIDPVPVDELKTIYPPNYYSFTHENGNWAFRIKEWLDKRLLKKILRQIPGPTVNVLDVGGGTGWLLDLVRKIERRTGTTQVVDIDNKARHIAEQKGHQYFEGRIEDFNTTKKFNLVLLLNLLEHIENPAMTLRKIAANLDDKGLMLVKTPNTGSMDANIFRKSYWGGLHCPRHWIIFSEKSFRIMVENTGLRIRELRFTQGGAFWAFSIIANLGRKKLLKLKSKRPIIFHPLFPALSSAFAAFDFIRRPFSGTSQMFIILEKK